MTWMIQREDMDAWQCPKCKRMRSGMEVIQSGQRPWCGCTGFSKTLMEQPKGVDDVHNP